jgi:hypothetical protein
VRRLAAAVVLVAFGCGHLLTVSDDKPDGGGSVGTSTTSSSGYSASSGLITDASSSSSGGASSSGDAGDAASDCRQPHTDGYGDPPPPGCFDGTWTLDSARAACESYRQTHDPTLMCTTPGPLACTSVVAVREALIAAVWVYAGDLAGWARVGGAQACPEKNVAGNAQWF